MKWTDLRPGDMYVWRSNSSGIFLVISIPELRNSNDPDDVIVWNILKKGKIKKDSAFYGSIMDHREVKVYQGSKR